MVAMRRVNTSQNNTSLVLSVTDDLLQGMTGDTKTTVYIHERGASQDEMRCARCPSRYKAVGG